MHGLSIATATASDFADLLPMMRAYCDFYHVDPTDDRLLALATALVDDPDEGLQLIARVDGTPTGFATIYWTWPVSYTHLTLPTNREV